MRYEVPLCRIEDVADVSAEAFIGSNDPIGNYMFQNEPQHLLLKRIFFRLLVTTCPPESVVHAVSPALEAVSIWYPPGIGYPDDGGADPFGGQAFADAGTKTRIAAVNEVIAALITHLGREPQWYLHLVAVRSAFLGQKYASLLVRPMLAKADTENIPCTLITQCQTNVQKYEHWGFRVTKAISVPCSQETFYAMRRPCQVGRGVLTEPPQQGF